MEQKKEQPADQDKSVFNMGVAMLQRIDQLLTAISVASARRSLTLWYDLLQSLQREVLYLMSDAEKEINVNHQARITPLINKYQFYEKKRRTLEFKEFGFTYLLLQDYETFIKHLLYARGMLVVKKTDASMF